MIPAIVILAIVAAIAGFCAVVFWMNWRGSAAEVERGLEREENLLALVLTQQEDNGKAQETIVRLQADITELKANQFPKFPYGRIPGAETQAQAMRDLHEIEGED